MCACVAARQCELERVADERVIPVSQLWALLHFIMPTLFDSHEEFNEWFSKDIESHAEHKSAIDESESGLCLSVSWEVMSFLCWMNYF